MTKILEFGEAVDGYPVPVLNERVARGGAGILLLFAIVAFMNAWLAGNFRPTRIFVVAFLADFFIRIFINPRFAPSLIAGQLAVRKQAPEYVGAAQKRFAWGIGFVLALAMFYLVVLNNVIGPFNLLICLTCLLLLFFETAFGICLGCKVYRWIYRNQPQLCPGEACTTQERATSQQAEAAQLAILAIFIGSVAAGAMATRPSVPADIAGAASSVAASDAKTSDEARCEVPDFAIAMGHEKQWKLHNNCK